MNDPIGKIIHVWNYTTYPDGRYGEGELEIVGVIKNFQASSLRNAIYPMVIVSHRGDRSYTSFARVTDGKEESAIREIKKVFEKYKEEGDSESPVRPVEEIFYELSKSERASLQLFTVLACICLLISIFGIYSISYSNMQQRRKEIAIRKVMGASPKAIVGIFFCEYLVIVIIANLLFLPIGWLFMNRWLEQYPYRTTISPVLFVFVLFISALLITVTIIYQTIRTARTNPVEAIKTD